MMAEVITKAHQQRRTQSLQYSLTPLYFGHFFLGGGGDFFLGGGGCDSFFFWGGDFFLGGGIFLLRGWDFFYSTVLYSTIQYNTVQYSTVQYSTVQYSTVQYSTLQYSTVQYSTVQYSTVHSTVVGVGCIPPSPSPHGQVVFGSAPSWRCEIRGRGGGGRGRKKVHLKTHGSTSGDRG